MCILVNLDALKEKRKEKKRKTRFLYFFFIDVYDKQYIGNYKQME